MMNANSSMMYVLGTSNAISESQSLKQQIDGLNADNEQLRRKLSAKNTECDKLKQQIKEIKLECDRYKQIMMQLNDTIVNQNGQTGKGRKYQQTVQPCQSCYAADKPYICDWQNCGKRFRKKPHLDIHKNVHTGRRFPCDWPNCGKSFVRKYNLIEHRKLHSSVNPNVCEFPNCGKFFSSKYSLMRHQSVQHSAQ
ncbi:zinc finger protein 382-like [Oppia nitens]|uniref:zinc finger protein 382-like n=1 Tax=Oppia nitens TaxID=1686743 RepID=UPI0023DC2405|nr:zinc finger protein 382-like [Oppia nitens]